MGRVLKLASPGRDDLYAIMRHIRLQSGRRCPDKFTTVRNRLDDTAYWENIGGRPPEQNDGNAAWCCGLIGRSIALALCSLLYVLLYTYLPSDREGSASCDLFSQARSADRISSIIAGRLLFATLSRRKAGQCGSLNGCYKEAHLVSAARY